MASREEIAATITGEGMPIGNEPTLPIRKDQTELATDGVSSPIYDDDAAGTIAWEDYRRSAAWLDTNCWLAEFQYADYLYQSPNYDRDFRGGGDKQARVSRFIVAKNVTTMATQVRRGIFGESSPFLLEPRGKLAEGDDPEKILAAWTELFNVLSDRADFEYQMGLFIDCLVLQGTAIAVPIWEQKEVIRNTRHRRAQPLKINQPVGPPKTVDTWESDDFKVREEKVSESWPAFEFRRLGMTLYNEKWRTPGRPDLSGFPRIDIDYVTLQDLQRMRAMSCYKNIPEDKDLKTFFYETAPLGDAEVGSRTAQSMSSQSTTVLHATGEQANTSQDPSLKPLMKIARWDESRVVELICYLGRRLVIRNEEHGIGDQAAGYSATWWNIGNSGYGMGIGRLNAGDQRINQGVLNEALKMIAFPMNAPLCYDRGAGNAPTQNVIAGMGQFWGIDTGRTGDVNKALAFLRLPEIPPEAWKFLDLSQRGGENLVGADSISMQGNVSQQGSSAMRTATGVQRAGGKADETIADPIWHLETVVKRWLYFLRDRVLEDMPIREIREILSNRFGQAILDEIDAEEFLAAEFEINILAGQKLAAKAAIMQLIPFLLQIVQQPQLMQWLHEKGWTINFKSIEDIFQRMSELESWQDIFVPLTPQEMQTVQQMNPGAQQVQAKVAQEKLKGQNKLQEIQAKGATDIQGKIIDKALEETSGDQELGLAEGRLERNTDMGELQSGVPGVGA